MRKLLCLVAAWLALWAGPASATLKVVSKSHPVTGIYGYDGVWRAALASDGSVINTVLTAAAAGDTVYVTPGSYDEQITNAAWEDGQVITGIRAVNVGGASAGTDNRWKAEIRRTAASNYVVVCPLGNGSDGASEVDGCRMEFMRIEQANATDRWGVDMNGAYDFRFYQCRFEGKMSYIMLNAAGEAPVRCKNFYVDACSLGVAPAATVNVNGLIYVGPAGAGAWGADNFRITNSTLDFSAVTISSGNAFIRMEAFLNCQITGNTIVWGTAASGNCFGIGLRSGTSGAISDSTLIADNSISGGTNATAGGSFGNIGLGQVAGTSVAVVDGVSILRNTLAVVKDNPDTGSRNFGIKVEGVYAGAITSDDTFSDRIVIAGNVVTGGYVGIGLHENARNSIVADNYVSYGDTTTSTDTQGIVLEDARRCIVSDNVIENTWAGIYCSSGSLAWKNFGNTVTGNWIAKCGPAIKITNAAADSVTRWSGNIAFACQSWATIASTHRTLAYWRATYLPAGIGAALYAGSARTYTEFWPHGVSDEQYENYPVALRRARALPHGTLKFLGSAIPGIQ